MSRKGMERTTIYLDRELKARLEAAAKSRGMTEAAVLREALTQHLGQPLQPAIRVVGKSEDGGVARHADDALAALRFGET